MRESRKRGMKWRPEMANAMMLLSAWFSYRTATQDIFFRRLLHDYVKPFILWTFLVEMNDD